MLKQFKSTVLSCAVSAVLLTGCNLEGIPDALIVLDENGESNTRPVIVMRGASAISIKRGDAFSDPGVIAIDAEDGDITEYVTSNLAELDFSREGTYQIIYKVRDSKNAEASPVARQVDVSAASDESVADAPTGDDGDVFDLSVPPIDALRLTAFSEKNDLIEVDTLVNGSIIDISRMPTNLLNIVADSTNEKDTGSVHFLLDGPTSIDRWENNPIYTMDIEGDHLDITNDELPVGDYTLTVTPYADSDMGGAKGISSSIAFSVIDSRTIASSSVPDVVSLEFVAIPENGDSVKIKQIKNGDTFNLSNAPADLVNIVAISKDISKTGSLEFKLDGPISLNRYENNAEYTMANAYQHLAIPGASGVEDGTEVLEPGSYTLVVTPYAGVDGTGEAGRPYHVAFTVASDGSSPNTPGLTPQLKANDDFYSIRVQDGNGTVTLEDTVGNNDSFDADLASFQVIEPPKNGQLEMFDSGAFEYSPDSGFTGQDSFVYQVQQDGVTDRAKASVTVVKPTAASGKGFTVFKPSSDSRIIYVSSSTGNDSNDCLSQSSPCKSLGAATEKMRTGKPDHLYLKAGDRWRGQSISGIQSGRSPSEPSVVALYGQGPRPVIETAGGNALKIVNKALQNVSIIGLHIYAYKHDPAHAEFTGKHADGDKAVLLGGHTNVLIEDCIFDFVELVIQDWQGTPTNITLRRNVFTGSYYDQSSFNRNTRPSNLYAKGINGLLIEENVFDYGGWNPKVKGAGANMYNHNLYIQYENVGNSIVVENNIITRASSHGVHGRPGGRYENNFFGRNAISLQMGYNGHPLPKGTFAKALNNVVTEGHSMYKGVDPCSGKNLCTPALWGITTADVGGGAITVKDNVVHSLASVDKKWTTFIQDLKTSGIGLNKPEQTDQANNIVWGWNGNDTTGKYPAPGRTLGDYYAQLQNNGKIATLSASGYVTKQVKGTDGFDSFMNLVRNRAPQTWDDSMTANGINSYIRAGFGK